MWLAKPAPDDLDGADPLADDVLAGAVLSSDMRELPILFASEGSEGIHQPVPKQDDAADQSKGTAKSYALRPN